MKFAMISRREPSREQVAVAAALGITLVHVGDRDAYSASLSQEMDALVAGGFQGIFIAHPLITLRALAAGLKVAVFENGNRAPVGAPPQFFPKGVTIL